MNHKITIAIDGYSSCGKSTLAKALAEKLGYIFIDSGAMYRAVALFCMENNLVENSQINENKLLQLIDQIHIEFKINQTTKNLELFLNNKNVAESIRSIEVSSLVSKVATIEKVRTKLVALQREMGINGGVVMDGRDIGSVVFPNAELKLFITSDPKIRAQRRFIELQNKNPEITIEEVESNLKERDFIDSTRAISPLIQPKDAILIDNTFLNQNEQLEIALKLTSNIISESMF